MLNAKLTLPLCIAASCEIKAKTKHYGFNVKNLETKRATGQRWIG
jgi:hypothetical protein